MCIECVPVGAAMLYGCQEIVELLLQNRADPNMKMSGQHWNSDYQNKTASEVAKVKGHSKIESLISNHFLNYFTIKRKFKNLSFFDE